MRHQRRHEKPAERARRTGIWRDRLAWQVLFYMGLQSMTFYMLVTWFAPIAQSLGRTEVVAGIDVMIYQFFCFGGTLIVPLLLRGGFARYAAAAIPALTLLGIAGLIAVPDFFVVWTIVCGVGCGAALGMSLSLFSLRARTHHGASALSGMAQSGGYLIAATGPILFGALLTLTGGWLAPLILVGRGARRPAGRGRAGRPRPVRARAAGCRQRGNADTLRRLTADVAASASNSALAALSSARRRAQ